jgi:hypothetical protein
VDVRQVIHRTSPCAVHNVNRCWLRTTRQINQSHRVGVDVCKFAVDITIGWLILHTEYLDIHIELYLLFDHHVGVKDRF